MDFKLNSDQVMLQDSVRRFGERSYGFDARTAQLQQGKLFAHWPTFADNGWLAAGIPEACGGVGGDAVDVALIAQELGRVLAMEPFASVGVMPAQVLLAGGSEAQKTQFLPPLVEGKLRMSVAYSEPSSRGNPAVTTLKAVANAAAGGYGLSGLKTLVVGGADADLFLVSAQVPDTTGITLFLVNADAPGLSQRRLRLHDGSQATEVVFDQVQVSDTQRVGAVGAGLPALQQGYCCAVTALCAELIGVMEAAIEMTAEYLKTRKQFGVAIGSFQVLQHRMVDMAGDLEVSRSMLHALLDAETNAPLDDRLRMVSQAKSLIGRLAKAVCGQAIQLHGGIGMTEEYAVGHYFKRAVVANILFGTGDQHDSAAMAELQASATLSQETP